MGPRTGQKVFTLRTVPAQGEEREARNGAAQAGGFSLHAGLDIQTGQRAKLERLCRYVSRPPLAVARLALSASGQVRYLLKTPYRDGTTHIVLATAGLDGVGEAFLEVRPSKSVGDPPVSAPRIRTNRRSSRVCDRAQARTLSRRNKTFQLSHSDQHECDRAGNGAAAHVCHHFASASGRQCGVDAGHFCQNARVGAAVRLDRKSKIISREEPAWDCRQPRLRRKMTCVAARQGSGSRRQDY